ncbi:MAG: tRNA uridine-5-carboxymethylaminomethyl(34) synthesis GTPase MnmE [Gemmatimonadaceae bacterium]|nr:tRNA uridine-5-carboxymethylaminomethyl(34) synthesis GTPase MnmE [Gemmatimonadaceae bacterium]
MREPGSAALRSLPGMGDTIVAIATPGGRGAVAVVRLSGNRAVDIASRHIAPWVDSANEVHLADVRDSQGNLLDRALVSVFRAPRSFTGEDVVEVSTHGGVVVPQSVVAMFIAAGARQAAAGEFTRRAVANGKLDITQAEAIADLVDAQSRSMQRAALSQMDGALSRRIHELRESLLELEAFLAYDIDFPEEDDGPIGRETIAKHAAETLHALRSLISTGAAGELVREGAVVVIAGPPNVGKSSLFNALLGHSRAIVTDIPGTTRDALEALVDAGDFPIRLVDTAGLRQSDDFVEKLGIEVSKKYLGAADVVLACAETQEQLRATLDSLLEITDVTVIPVLTKRDLVALSSQSGFANDGGLEISTLTGEGIPLLLETIQAILKSEHVLASDTPLLTRARHIAAVTTAADELEDFLANWTSGRLPATVAAIHVRASANALEELIGVVDVEHVLDRVFSSFCVGK